jgi:hypothetical protein
VVSKLEYASKLNALNVSGMNVRGKRAKAIADSKKSESKKFYSTEEN